MPLGEPQQPVTGFPLKFRWLTGEWEQVFDEQVKLVRTDIQRARLDGKIVVYLSCPISARGGGHSGTNVDIAKFTERRLLREWGERFWVLNPAQYQLESKEGYGLLDIHAKTLKLDLRALLKKESPGGGDYMRMWTKILVEDSPPSSALPAAPHRNLGLFFDAYYFLGPTDVRAFFGVDGRVSLGASIEEYFSRKHSFERAFRDTFAVEPAAGQLSDSEKAAWDAKRRAFLLYYSLRASVTVSLGSHDEWAIFNLLNQARRKVPDADGGGIPNQIAGFFDGRALPISAGEAGASLGYAVPT
jgi:hypothetical protein